MAGADADNDSTVGLAALASDPSTIVENAQSDESARSDSGFVTAVDGDDDLESPSDSDSSSSEDTSSGESSSDEDDRVTDQQPDLRTRLAAFLPKISEANGTLSDSARIDDVGDDEERYIEMNLGLGVLEKQERDEVLTRTASTESEFESETGKEPTLEVTTEQPARKRRKIEEVG